STQMKIAPTSGGSNISFIAYGNRNDSIVFDADLIPTGYRLNATEGIWLQKAGSHFRILGSTTATPPAMATTFSTYFDMDVVTGNTTVGGQIASVPGTSRFDVVGASVASGSSRRLARLADSSAMAQDVGGGLDFAGKYVTATGAYTQFANLKGVKTNGTDSDQHGDLVFSFNNGTGNMIEGARLTTLSTDANKAQFNVTGDITASGVIHAKYQDVAEWVTASSEMTAGTVVVLDRKHDNVVTPSTTAYDTAVAGVVSSRPGLLLGEESASKAKIATTGRVKVHVDASRGSIAIGDLLVTSDKPGVAMRSEPLDLGGVKIHRPGTLIGKALEPLASGQSEILVLLSLQ
ncbi:MAG: hypothetical protein QOE82_308, partial [Thermoanaerobaculia bacterium]|nr:hypothetical protein [Thermoanaerobaculia bacterium]